MKLIRVLLNLLRHFYCGIQCDKTCNFVHDEEFEVQHEMPIFGLELERHTKSVKNVQFPSIRFPQYVTKVVFLTRVQISVSYLIENVNL